MPIRTRYVNIQFVPEFRIAYSKGNCKYRVAFVGKYCRKLLYKKSTGNADGPSCFVFQASKRGLMTFLGQASTQVMQPVHFA